MDECCAPPPLNLGGSKKQDDAYRRVLWTVLATNAAMFAVEVIAGQLANGDDQIGGREDRDGDDHRSIAPQRLRCREPRPGYG